MQITASVYWTQSAEEALVQGARQLLEIGPKRVLSGLCKRVQKDGAQFEISNIDRKEDVENVKSILST
jgi:malonyl CoA-acyl carrier protein transacylase